MALITNIGKIGRLIQRMTTIPISKMTTTVRFVA